MTKPRDEKLEDGLGDMDAEADERKSYDSDLITIFGSVPVDIFSAPFKFMLAINNKAAGKRDVGIVLSTITWSDLREKIAKAFDFFPSFNAWPLHTQYRFSVDAKDSLPCDLTCEEEFTMMLDLLRCHVVPPLLASGCRSQRPNKNVTVDIFKKGDEVTTAGKVCP